MHRPAALAGVRDAAREVLELRDSGERRRGEVQQPRADDAAAPPDLGDLGDVEVVLVELGLAQRRGLGVDHVVVLADVGVLDDVQALGERGHHAVLDPVVDHLHEVPGAGRAAVQVAVLGGQGSPVAARRARRRARRPARASEERVEPPRRPRRRRRSSGSSRARGRTRRRSCPCRRSGGPARRAPWRGDVVAVVGVAAVDDGVVGLSSGASLSSVASTTAAGHHHADRPRRRRASRRSPPAIVAPVAPSPCERAATASGLTS